MNTADDYDVEQPMYDETDGDVTDDVTNRPLLSDEDYDYLFGKDSDRKLSELYDDYVEGKLVSIYLNLLVHTCFQCTGTCLLC